MDLSALDQSKNRYPTDKRLTIELYYMFSPDKVFQLPFRQEMVLMTVLVREKICSEVGRIGFLGLTVEDRGVKTVNKEQC